LFALIASGDLMHRRLSCASIFSQDPRDAVLENVTQLTGMSQIDMTYFCRFENLNAVCRMEHGILAEIDDELLRVDVLREDVIRLKISRGCIFDENPTHAVCAGLEDSTAEFRVEEDDAKVQVITSRLTLTIDKKPFRIDAHRADGSLIFETLVEPDGKSWAYATLNDAFVIKRTCRREDAIFGLGEKTGRFNRKGRDFTLWNTDVMNPNHAGEFIQHRAADDPRSDATSTEFDPYYVSMPFFYHLPHESSAMAGFFFDNGYQAHFEFSRPLEYHIHFSGGQYTEYIFAGPQMPAVLDAYSWLTGRMQPPPLWALGHHQCRWFGYTQESVKRLGKRHRERKIPCDVLWLDIDYMDDYRVFTWNRDKFPDPKAMLRELRELGFRVITIIDPGVKYEHGYAVFDEAVERNLLCKTESGAIYVGQVWPGRTAFPDFAKAEGRRWWGEWNARHVESGLAGIWNDMNEPSTGEIPSDGMLFEDGKSSHAKFHNQYALLMAMGTTEGLLKAMPDKRTFVLSRAGFSGIQRYAANWLGDNISRWDHLWMSMPMALGFGISGQPFIGADIGGFGENSSAELLVRWYQMGALTPFFRNHNSTNQNDQYPWVYGEAIEDLCRKAIEFRYRLLPYIYSQFMRSAETGAPVQKPLIFDYQTDRTARDMDDQYLFGDHLLVAPVFLEHATARQVYLPRGTWFRWHTGEKKNGPSFVIADAPMDYIPLYVRGGAVIPMWPESPQSTMGYHPERIELHIFLPDENGITRSMLHEDDGQTFGFRNGEFLRTEFQLHRDGSKVKLEATVSGNGYAEFLRKEFRLHFHGHWGDNLTLDGNRLSVEAGQAVIANSGTSFSIEATVP
jgi:alpha-glucosidase